MKDRIIAPELSDCATLIERLARGYYARFSSTQEPLPCFSDDHLDGLVVVVYSEEPPATALAKDAAAAYQMGTEAVRIIGLWDFFRHCASCGFTGVALDGYYPVTFHCRLTDLDRTSPTLAHMGLPDSTNDLKGFFFGRRGVVQAEPGSMAKWIDYEKLDKASCRHHLSGQPLPEPIDAHVIIAENDKLHTFPSGASFLGPYVSDMGAIPVFSGRIWAEYFARLHGVLVEPVSDDEVPRLIGGLVLKKVDLLDFLEDVAARDWPFVDIGLNSLCHRFRQGWFFCQNNSWFLESISGVWEIQRQGLIPRPDIRPYKSYLGKHCDTPLLSSGVFSVVEHPFKRLVGADRSSLPEDDATAILDSELSESFEPQTIEAFASIPIDAFVIDAFDKITGYQFALSTFENAYDDLGFLVFPDAIAACSYLVHEVLPHDEQTRTNGHRLCHGGGSLGSQDPERESRVTSSIVAAMRKVLLDALTQGYRPEHGLHIGRLMQDVTVTFEVTDIGYFGDLLFYGTSDGRGLEDRLDTGDPEDPNELKQGTRRLKRLRAAKKKIADQIALSPKIVAELRLSLGDTYDRLAAESCVIAVTVVEEFERTGMRPGYDYAGISMKASKLIERELRIRVFRPWRDAMLRELGKARLSTLGQEAEIPIEETEQVLIAWLQKKSKLDLGGMRFCLSETREATDSQPMRKRLGEYLNHLPGGRWLTSEEFEAALLDISTKYRNGGVHEHLVSFDICQEAVNRILLGQQPLLQRLVKATAGSIGK